MTAPCRGEEERVETDGKKMKEGRRGWKDGNVLSLFEDSAALELKGNK
jgi:hypothetical protein